MWHLWGGAVEVHTGFWWGDLRERSHLEDLGVDGRIILKRILKKRDRASRDCIYLAQDSLRVLVDVVTNRQIPQNAENLLTS